MSVPDDQIVSYHIERCLEDSLISLGLPEFDIEPVCFVTDSSVGFPDFSHGYVPFTAIQDDSPPEAVSQR
jgi:hypothetical protein